MKQLWKSRIGLALGGGAARGSAHLGVLKALEEHNIPLHAIAGTSVGAVVAALYAFGKKPDEIYDIAREMSMGKISGFTLKKKGFSTTERLEKLIIDEVGDVNIEDASIPLAIVATNLYTGQKTIFTHGNLAKAVAASAAVPGFFIPVEIDGVEYVDGGLVENVPVSALKLLGANAVIAVNLSGNTHYPAPTSALEVMSNALDIAINGKTKEQVRKASAVIQLDLWGYSRTDNREVTDDLIETGYQETIKRMDRIRWCLYTPILQKLIRFYHQTSPITVPDFIRNKIGRYKEPKTEVK